MFFEMLKKELKVYFSSKMNIIFMFILPLLFIGLFSVALKDYIGADYGTFDRGRLQRILHVLRAGIYASDAECGNCNFYLRRARKPHY